MSKYLPLTVAVIAASLAWVPVPAWSQDAHKDEPRKEEKNQPAKGPGNAPAQHGAALPGAPRQPGQNQPGHPGGQAAGQHPGGGGGQAAGQRPGGSAQAAARPGSGGGRPEGGHRVAGDFRGRGDPRHWNGNDRAMWQGGHWHQDWHDGRYGWWWEVAGIWYFYDQPFYPFPLFVSPVVDLPPPEPAIVAPMVMAPPPPPPPVPLAAQAQYWYYCDNPPGYYPYVPTCSVGWRQVPAQTR